MSAISAFLHLYFPIFAGVIPSRAALIVLYAAQGGMLLSMWQKLGGSLAVYGLAPSAALR
ncbi:hypothetical protein ATN84_09995 [Paramesorhizobium deserti]|uniref:Uncharacterized protein n=2 Tax=Paramesorhizobium deserti TaxID=1494590 RepID=A0A135HWW3_9HYPH|nr:hypothetical protein ATN84_09995 [Paramesorhizobium deserti]